MPHLNILFIIVLLYIALFITEAMFYILDTRRFIANAIRTTATVVSSKLYRATKSSVHIPTITFTDQEGKLFTVEARLAGISTVLGKWEKAGNEIVILYEKENPQNFIVDSLRGKWTYTFKRSAIVLLIIIAIGIAAIFLF